MRGMLLGAALTLTIGGLAFAGTSNPELMITDGATVLCGVAGQPAGCTGNTGNGSVTYSNANFGGWNITIIAGASNSPGETPFALDLTTLAVECAAASCSTLTVDLSDIGFTPTKETDTVGYSATDTGAAASTSESGYYSTTNNYFALTSLIGTVGPFVGAGAFAGHASGPGPTTSPYSFTLVNTFAACTGAGCASYSSDSNITSIPEPASVALFGTVLVFCASRLRRRKAS